MNPTIEKFGYPGTLIKAFEHWVVLARPAQPTLGSLVLAAKSGVQAFSDLPNGAHAELAEVTKTIETALRETVDYAKINYLMLMMMDNEVHFHVIPRYEGEREWRGHTFADAGWPKLPDLGQTVALKGEDLDALVAWLKRSFS